ncbi:hypothetical protein FAZ69_08480 [Trinickia terrae]|uniref:Uncharacterized protein n=1 Tax=Trinickia terrae TaxID=2571161 RepID=A0A4U1I9L9_9BURK|nr:hypothetical protein [Trinickia terrae]TKC90173.1 hypothetical protein FAZ69_08480 [Trinickia terrae]
MMKKKQLDALNALPSGEGEAQRQHVENEADKAAKVTAEAAEPGMLGVEDADALMDELLERVGNGPAAAPAATGVPAAQVSGGAAVQDSVGNVAAGVVTAPFYALSSAYRLLNKAVKPGSPQAAGLPGLSASAQPGMMAAAMGGVGAPLAATEMISHWKCDKIEDAQRHVLKAAEALRNVDAFPLWEDAMLAEAGKRGMLPSDLVARMRNDPDLAPLKEQMTALWRDNPKEVEAYRQAAGEFEKHIKDVQRKYANSEPPIQKRVIDAMETVRESTGDLPGFGRQEGEYTATLAERLRELARTIAESVSNLLVKLQGRAPSASVAASPEPNS